MNENQEKEEKLPEIIIKIDEMLRINADLQKMLLNYFSNTRNWWIKPRFGITPLFFEQMKLVSNNDYGNQLRRIYFELYRIKKYAGKNELQEVFPLINKFYSLLNRFFQDFPPRSHLKFSDGSDCKLQYTGPKTQQVQLLYNKQSILITPQDALLLADTIYSILNKYFQEFPRSSLFKFSDGSDCILQYTGPNTQQVQLLYNDQSILMTSKDALRMADWLKGTIPQYLIKSRTCEYLEKNYKE